MNFQVFHGNDAVFDSLISIHFLLEAHTSGQQTFCRVLIHNSELLLRQGKESQAKDVFEYWLFHH